MGFLIDTNIVSELHKGERANARVRQWFEAVDEGDLFISALTLSEIRNGIERLRRRDPASAGRDLTYRQCRSGGSIAHSGSRRRDPWR
jgi:hypothetical protein